jgi:hypothetical protein
MKSQYPRKKVKDPAARIAPDIPADIREVALSDDVFAEPEISFRECLIENISFKRPLIEISRD